MPAEIRVIGMRTKMEPYIEGDTVVVNTTSHALKHWEGDLSPFRIGPVPLYDGHHAENVENAQQFCKVYREHADELGNPSEAYWEWAKTGWADTKAHRYPMGKGRKPLYSYWDGERLGYIEARKRIYVPLYALAVVRTRGFEHLRHLYEAKDRIVLRDYDGYDHVKKGWSLTDCLDYPKRPMGHAFVLAMLLTMDEALKQCDLTVCHQVLIDGVQGALDELPYTAKE